MEDKKLLELAAKASGWSSWDWLAGNGVMNVYDADGHHDTFNPLEDDGDALRLAVRLGLMVDAIRRGYKEGHVCAVHSIGAFYEPKMPDPYAATRRAIVRAAAEIGA